MTYNDLVQDLMRRHSGDNNTRHVNSAIAKDPYDNNWKVSTAKNEIRKSISLPKDTSKSKAYNKIKQLNAILIQDYKVDPHKKFDHPDSVIERYNNIADILRVPLDVVKQVLEGDSDPVPDRFKPVKDPLRGEDKELINDSDEDIRPNLANT